MTRIRFKSCLVALVVFAAFQAQGLELFETVERYATETQKWIFVYKPLRAALHEKIVEKRLQAGKAEAAPRLIFTAGPAGAGKSFVTEALEKLDILDVSNFLWIDPDAIKDDIPEYADFKKANPERAASLVHRESGHIQERLFNEALRHGKNIIVDGTLLGKDWWISEFRRIKQEFPRYSISIFSVTAPESILLARVAARGRVTGRFVPEDMVISMARGVAESIATLAPFADLTVEIENGMTPAIKSIKMNGRALDSHVDLGGMMGRKAVAQTALAVPSVDANHILNMSSRFAKVVVVGGHGTLGYEDFSLLRAYVENIESTHGAGCLFVFTHQNGIGRAGLWLLQNASEVMASEGEIAKLFLAPELRQKIEFVSLRGELQELRLLNSSNRSQIPTTLVRDAGLEPETEAVALALTRNPRFNMDPTAALEVDAQSGMLRIVRTLELPNVQRLYESRTRALRFLSRRMERSNSSAVLQSVTENYPELTLLTDGVIETPEAFAQAQPLTPLRIAPLSSELQYLSSHKDLFYPKQLAEPDLTATSLWSEKIFGRAFAEYDRAVGAAVLLRHLVAGDHAAFTAAQPDATRLSLESFTSVAKIIRQAAGNASTRDALLSFVVLNQIGKSQAVISFLRQSSGISEINHQRVMYDVLRSYPFVSPTFQRLDESQRSLVLKSFEREFNLAQFIQGEAPARYLREHAFRSESEQQFYVATSLLKVAAAGANVNAPGSIVLTEPVFQGLDLGIKAFSNLPHDDAGLIAAYRRFMIDRSQALFSPKEWASADLQIAVTRLCLIFRCGTPADGEIVRRVFDALPADLRHSLQHELLVTGLGDETATLLYYAPAAMDIVRKLTSDSEQNYLFGMQVLTAAFQSARQHIHERGLRGNVLQIRMDSVVRQLKDFKSIPDLSSIGFEIYNDPSFGPAMKIKVDPCGEGLGVAHVSQ